MRHHPVVVCPRNKSRCDDFCCGSRQDGCPTVHEMCLGPSTMPWRMQLVNLNLLSTLSKVARRFKFPVSQKSCRNVFRCCHVKGRLDVQACLVHRGSGLASLPFIFLCVLLPLPVFLQHLSNEHLNMLTPNPVDSSTHNCFPALGCFVPFQTLCDACRD